MSIRMGALVAMSLTMALGACASRDDVRALRRPTLPPQAVVMAVKSEPVYQSIAMYEVLGAPEFTLFDGGDVMTTRPKRREVIETMNQWLGAADMAAPNLKEARYLLSIRFDSLRGPDVVPFSDKDAASTAHYRLEDARTREVVYEQTFSSAFRTRMPGVTPEMARGAIAGALVGAAYGGAQKDADRIDVADGAGAGAAAVFIALAPTGRQPEELENPDTIGAFNGSVRREQAVDWMMRRNFNQFLIGLSERDMVSVRRAVPCAALNAEGMRGPAIITQTPDAVGYDCPR